MDDAPNGRQGHPAGLAENQSSRSPSTSNDESIKMRMSGFAGCGNVGGYFGSGFRIQRRPLAV